MPQRALLDPRGHARPIGKRARGVSPIIAMILLVAIVVVLAAVMYVLVTGLVRGPSAPSIGTALAVGQPVAGQCWMQGVTNHVCGTTGDRLWNLTIEESSVTLGDMLVEVHASTGSIFKNTGAAAFSVMVAGVATPAAYYTVAANAGLAMHSGFTYNAGYSSGTEVTSAMYLVIGTGTPSANWVSGQGNYVTIVGTNHYSGNTAPAILP
jgi:flagellin-like protein